MNRHDLAAALLDELGSRWGGSATGPLFVAGPHRFNTGVRQGVSSFEMLLDQKILFRQILQRRFVPLQVRTEEAQHFPRNDQIPLECAQDRFLGWGQQRSLPRKGSYDLT